jgi:hypothetical protein
MSRTSYEDPVEQVMFILGLKHDPKFDTALHAIAHSSTPGILDAKPLMTSPKVGSKSTHCRVISTKSCVRRNDWSRQTSNAFSAFSTAC